MPSSNLELTVTKRGLRYSIEPPDTSYVRDLVENIKAGNVSGSSFEFRVHNNGEAWVQDEDGEPIRELRAIDVFEVGPVTRPAYPQTDVALRSLEAWRSTQAEEAAEAEQPQTPTDVLRDKISLTERTQAG